MSLLTIFELLDFADKNAVELLKRNCQVGGLKASLISRRKSQIWSILETGNEDMFIGDAHWDNPMWRIQPFAVTALCEILEHMVMVSPSGLNFSMAWVGDRLEPASVTLDELRKVFMSGEFGAKTEYQYRAP